MILQRLRQIHNVFDAVMERESTTRTAFLEGDYELRSEGQCLIAAHEQVPGWLDKLVGEGLREAQEQSPDEKGTDAPAPRRREGRRIGPYEILRELGAGRDGTVYLAARADGVFRKFVAIKIVKSDAASPEALRRFQQEREILASLDHPNIARILDGGSTEEGLPYLVMEYVEGKRIDVYCDEHRLSVNERLRLLKAVFSAIRYAHEKHVVHWDLRQDNILVTTDGVVKLLDFGIAKLLPGAEDTISLTRTNLLAMTPEYASPEQIRGELVTPLSDVYSLGMLAYELLTGRRPYRLRTRIFHEIARVIRRKARPRLKYEAGFKRIFAVLAVCWVAYYLGLGIAVIVRGGYIDVGFLVSRLAVAFIVLVVGYILFFGVVPWVMEGFRYKQ